MIRAAVGPLGRAVRRPCTPCTSESGVRAVYVATALLASGRRRPVDELRPGARLLTVLGERAVGLASTGVAEHQHAGLLVRLLP